MRPFSDVDLHAFVDNQVSPERRALIAAYLQGAPAEAARVQGWRRQNEAIRNVFTGAASEPVPLWLTIGQVASGRERAGKPPLGYTASGQPLRAVPFRRTVRRGRTMLGPVAAATVAAVLAFAAGTVLPDLVPQWSAAVDRWLPATPHDRETARVAARTLDAHRTFGMDPDRPAEVVDQPAGTLAAWFRHRLGMAVPVPDLSRQGWALKGGRIVPGDLGPAALLIYENPTGDRLSVTAMRVGNPSPFDTSYGLSGPVLVWLDGPVGFGVATSKEGNWLVDNAQALYRGLYAGTD